MITDHATVFMVGKQETVLHGARKSCLTGGKRCAGSWLGFRFGFWFVLGAVFAVAVGRGLPSGEERSVVLVFLVRLLLARNCAVGWCELTTLCLSSLLGAENKLIQLRCAVSVCPISVKSQSGYTVPHTLSRRATVGQARRSRKTEFKSSMAPNATRTHFCYYK